MTDHDAELAEDAALMLRSQRLILKTNELLAASMKRSEESRKLICETTAPWYECERAP